MMIDDNDLVVKAREWIKKHFTENVPDQYVYHNYQHSVDVAQSAAAISSFYELHDQELIALYTAAYFHDSGYDQGSKGHEDRGKSYARAFLESESAPEADIVLVEGLIEATKPQITPQTLLQKVLKDADTSHVGSDHYWDRCSRVRQELLLTQKGFMSEDEWVEFELQFIKSHQFITDAAYTLYQEKKKKNINRLKKYAKRVQKANINLAKEREASLDPPKRKKKKKKDNNIELKQISLGRGVETMFRTTYRTHLNLSAIADNKANIMLSINAIIISIAVSNLVPQFEENDKLIIPTLILLGVCLVALVFAILSTRPKITEGTFTREDIRQKKSNLLFFGNFYRMEVQDFHWGMKEMIKDSDFLYSSMTRDLYYLGVVLAKKYQYLRICYSVFMYGLIASVLAFGLAYFL